MIDKHKLSVCKTCGCSRGSGITGPLISERKTTTEIVPSISNVLLENMSTSQVVSSGEPLKSQTIEDPTLDPQSGETLKIGHQEFRSLLDALLARARAEGARSP